MNETEFFFYVQKCSLLKIFQKISYITVYSSYSIMEVQFRTWPNGCNLLPCLRPWSLLRHQQAGRPLCFTWQGWSIYALRGLTCPVAWQSLGPRAHSYSSCSVESIRKIEANMQHLNLFGPKRCLYFARNTFLSPSRYDTAPRNVAFENPFLYISWVGPGELAFRPGVR